MENTEELRAFVLEVAEPIRAARRQVRVSIPVDMLNPELLKGKKGGRIYRRLPLRDRIDTAIAHECEELRHGGSHAAALKAAAKTELPITPGARRLNRAMAR